MIVIIDAVGYDGSNMSQIHIGDHPVEVATFFDTKTKRMWQLHGTLKIFEQCDTLKAHAVWDKFCLSLIPALKPVGFRLKVWGISSGVIPEGTCGGILDAKEIGNYEYKVESSAGRVHYYSIYQPVMVSETLQYDAKDRLVVPFIRLNAGFKGAKYGYFVYEVLDRNLLNSLLARLSIIKQ